MMVRLVVRLRAYGPGTPNGTELVSVYSLLDPKPYTALANPRSETRTRTPVNSSRGMQRIPK